MELSEIVERLRDVVNPDFLWPEVPKGWQLEFIAYSNTDIDMDLLHPVSGRFWSEDHGHLETPAMTDGSPITAVTLKAAGVPFMTTFGTAAVSESSRDIHLTVVDKNSN